MVLRGLVDRAVAGDPDAWEALYRRSYGPLFGFARRRLFDDQAAEDRGRYQSEEEEARLRKRGLWVDDAPVPLWDWRSEARAGR